MKHKPSPRRTGALSSRLSKWARRTGFKSPRKLVGDLTDIYAAAGKVMDSVEELATRGSRSLGSDGKVLLDIQIWLYRELHEHLMALKNPLAKAISDFYSKED